MKKLIIIGLVAFAGLCYSQNIVFERTFNFVPGWGRAQGIDTTENGGYIIGSSANFPNVPSSAYLSVTGVTIKLDTNGDTLWTRNAPLYFTIYDDHAVSFNKSYYLQTSFFTGATYTGSNLTDTVYLGVHKLQVDGSLTFSKNYILNGRNSISITKSTYMNNNNDVLLFCLSRNSKITYGQGGGISIPLLELIQTVIY